MFRRQDWNDPRSIRFAAKIDHDMAQIRFFAAPNRAIGQKDKLTERGDLPHQPVAVNPRLYTLLERKIHTRRAHFDVQ